MQVRKPDEKIELQKPGKSDMQKLQESIEKLDKKIDRLFKLVNSLSSK